MRIEILENQMRRYLLGDLPEAEAIALEQQLFAEDESFEQMWEIENSLVDGYVRRRLSPADRAKFESHYLVTPVHFQRVKLAEDLIKKADGSMTEKYGEEPKVSWLANLLGIYGTSGSRWRLAPVAAAILLLLAGSVWLSIDDLRLRREMARIAGESERQRIREEELSDQIAATRNQNEDMRGALERLRGEHNNVTQPEARNLRGIISFTLSPRLIRSGNNPQSLAIPGDAAFVRLLMRVEQGDSRTFEAAVREVGGRQIWKVSTLKPRLENSDYAVSVDIPAGRLVPGDYILKLSTLDSAGEPEEIASYFFRITKL
jgi:hypothetical protein